MNQRLFGGEIIEIGDCTYIKRHDLTKNKEDLLKRILFCTIFDRKEHIEFLLKNYSKKFLSKEESEKIIKIFNIKMIDKKVSPIKWAEYSAAKDFLDGSGY